MHYEIRHTTRFRYSKPIVESAMEVRMQPRTEAGQVCHDFRLTTQPYAQAYAYRDHLGNAVYHFDVPGRHAELTILATASVDGPPAAAPEPPTADAWQALDALAAAGENWDLLNESPSVPYSPALQLFERDLGIARNGDPLAALRELNEKIFSSCAYDSEHTRVDSPIDEALDARRGVCQDFAHIMIGLARRLGVPTRYVSGYLAPSADANDRSPDWASHAWVECWLPGSGWVGFDPTNNILASDRHIRVAVGRDYFDVPPTRGVFKGQADSELAVSVKISETEPPAEPDDRLHIMRALPVRESDEDEDLLQQQQQQQQ